MVKGLCSGVMGGAEVGVADRLTSVQCCQYVVLMVSREERQPR